MMATDTKPITRAYLSIGAALAFLVLVVSGTALYTAPPCSVADRIGWRFLFLSKENWEGIHITFALSFLILASLHLWYNWSVFLRHLRERFAGPGIMSRPLLITIAAAVALFLMAAFHVPPVSWIHDAHEMIKFSWGERGDRGPGFPGQGRGKFRNHRGGKTD
ncbi:MAG: DUF4405 domain-containing protein [Spirochaetes bacterium]|nr:DUF4405 domain-containing protein [Spirochaetota bacterium]